MFFKHVLGPLVILVRLMPVLLSMPVRGDLCPNFPISNPAIVKHINATTGTQHCCRQILCPAGTEVQYCSLRNPNDTLCRPCPMGYYNKDAQQSDQNPTCHQWKRCPSRLGQVSNNDGTKIFEGTCHCNVALGHYANKWGECRKRKAPCLPNHELSEKTGHCIPCRLGHEQPVTGYGPCQPCSIGTHRPNDMQLNCTACPAGKYTVREGQHKCSTCKELMEANESDLPCNPKMKQPVTPKIDASTSDEGRSNGLVVKVLVPVLCVMAVLVLLCVLFVVHRRRTCGLRQTSEQDEKRKSPVHDSSLMRPNYRAVSSSSTSSSDDASRSSAEDALEAEKIKAQNMMNQGVSVSNEKMGIPKDDINTDCHSPPADQQPSPGNLQNMLQEPERLLIMNPTNCNITLGHSNQLSMTPVPQPRPPPVEELNLNNIPRSRQSAPPTLDLNGGEYINGAAPAYYEDEADRIAAHYNPQSNC